MPVQIFGIIGVFFGLVAGVMAFLITFDELEHHRLGRWRTWRESLGTGVVAFLFFLIGAIVIGVVKFGARVAVARRSAPWNPPRPRRWPGLVRAAAAPDRR